jgi:magnesium chelatase subunit D
VNEQWLDALLAAACMAVAPQSVKGIQLRATAGPLRDFWLTYYAKLVRAPIQKIPCTVDEERLIGGIDIAASLTLGRPKALLGLLHSSNGQTLVFSMAERLQHRSAALIAQAMETEDFGTIALDESTNDDEAIANCLDENLPVILTLGGITRIDFEALSLGYDSDENELPIKAIELARASYHSVAYDENTINALCSAAIALGVNSMRAPIAALRLAKIHAALQGRALIEEDDLSFAVRVVIAPRATQLPTDPQDSESAVPEDANNPPQDNDVSNKNEDQSKSDEDTQSLLPENEASQVQDSQNLQEFQELILQAAIASIPADLLASLQNSGKPLKGKSAGSSGATQRGGQRGRSAGTFRKKPNGQAKIHLLHTLRASIVWQKIRKQQAIILNNQVEHRNIIIRKDDFRYQKIEQKTKSTIVFAIDASGSSALHRLAEAKGAIELLLAQCYVRRDQVAVIAFRGTTAEIILPPTRSLTRAKRSLAGLPGGGGTPLAAAIDCVTALTKSIHKKGETPFVVLLTDGRANVSRSGVGGRIQAQEDAKFSAKEFYAEKISAIVLDTSPQPHYLAQGLAADMGATYLPLPFAGAQAISSVVQQSYRNAS